MSNNIPFISFKYSIFCYLMTHKIEKTESIIFCSIRYITNQNSSCSNNGYGTPPQFLKIALDIFSNSRNICSRYDIFFCRKLFGSLIWKRFLMNYVITEKVRCFKDSNLVCYVMIIRLQRFVFFYKQHLINLHIFFSPNVINNHKVFTKIKL